MSYIVNKLAEIGIVPVVVIEDAKQAVGLGQALLDGGVPCAEITFRTKAAASAIHALSEELPDLLVGAGTVLTTEQVDLAVDAGAGFVVSPGLNPNIVQYCRRKGIPIVPGVATPSEVERALELGLDAVKFFPAEQAGGADYIKALSAPYSGVRFLPTGGITAANIADYIKLPSVFAVGGSYMVAKDLIQKGDWAEITRLSDETVKLIKSIRG